MLNGKQRLCSLRLILVGLAVLAALGVGLGDALAQGWNWWPFGGQSEPRPIPREPLYRGPPGQAPPGYPPGPPGQYPPAQYPPGQAPPGQPYWGQRGANTNICQQLEQRLVAETQGSGQNRDQLPKIETDLRQTERSLTTAQIQLDRADCWDQFLFSKTLRRTPRCVQLNTEVENLRRRLAELDGQRRQILGTRDRSYQDDIIRELARNGCGPQYAQEARRRDAATNPFSALWSDEGDAPRGPGNQFGNLPFATYRTLCVRLCDGYYFPVSFSTLPNHFQRDAEVCQSRCAAPAELYYHQNPGGAVEQAISVTTQQPYTSLKSAWRYRKEFVQGCSCKEAEYVPAPGAGEKKADAAPVTPPPRSEARLLTPR
jgi:uncharacterized protein DUF2865